MSTTKSKTRKTIANAKLSMKKMASDVKDPLAIVGGMVVGKLASDLLDKGFTKVQTVSGLKGLNGTVQSVMKPLILIVAGLAGKQMLKNPLMKNASLGVAAYAAAEAVTEAFNLPVLQKISGTTPAALPAATGTAGMRGIADARYNYRNIIAPSVPPRQLRPEMLPDLTNVQTL